VTEEEHKAAHDLADDLIRTLVEHCRKNPTSAVSNIVGIEIVSVAMRTLLVEHGVPPAEVFSFALVAASCAKEHFVDLSRNADVVLEQNGVLPYGLVKINMPGGDA